MPRLGPSRITPEEFAGQVFRSTHVEVDRLPAQLRGAVVTGAIGRMTVQEALALIDSGQRSGALEPHDAFLAFSGQSF